MKNRKMDNEKIVKMLIVCECMRAATSKVADYLEEPPKEVSESLSFIRHCHDFFKSAAVYITEDESLINSLPEEIKDLWNGIDVESIAEGALSELQERLRSGESDGEEDGEEDEDEGEDE